MFMVLKKETVLLQGMMRRRNGKNPMLATPDCFAGLRLNQQN
jgi:hypothetical protein